MKTIKNCEYCSQSFIAQTERARFCSGKCNTDSQGYDTNPELLASARLEFVNNLKYVYELLGHPPTIKEYSKYGNFGYTRVYRLFKSRSEERRVGKECRSRW